MLEEAGIIGDVNIAEFPLYFLPLEQDILSLELDDAVSDLYLVSCSRAGLGRGILTSNSTRTLDASSTLPKR